MWGGVGWQLVTSVSEQHIGPNFKGPSRNVGSWVPARAPSYTSRAKARLHRDGSLKSIDVTYADELVRSHGSSRLFGAGFCDAVNRQVSFWGKGRVGLSWPPYTSVPERLKSRHSFMARACVRVSVCVCRCSLCDDGSRLSYNRALLLTQF